MTSCGARRVNLSPALLPGKGRLTARPRSRAIAAVQVERDYQNERWGNHFPERCVTEWVTILTEEVGELAQASLDIRFAKDVTTYRAACWEAISEAVQVAACCRGNR